MVDGGVPALRDQFSHGFEDMGTLGRLYVLSQVIDGGMDPLSDRGRQPLSEFGSLGGEQECQQRVRPERIVNDALLHIEYVGWGDKKPSQCGVKVFVF